MTIASMVRISLVVMLLSSIANAQPQPEQPTEATKLFEEGRELAKQNKYVEACEKFSKSYELDRGVGTEVNLADCHEHLGHFAEAWRLFDDAALQSKATNPTREKFARDRATALEKKLVVVVVKLPDATGATVTIGGKPATVTGKEVRQRVDPGKVDVVVVIPDKQPWTSSKQGTAGQTVTFDASSPSEPVSDIKPIGGGDQPLPEPTRKKSRVYLAIGLGAAGGVGVITSVAFGAKARSDYNSAANSADCPVKTPLTCNDAGRKKIHDAQGLADVATGVAIAGLVLGAAGAVIYFTAPKEIMLSPTASADNVGVTVSGHF